MTIDGGESAAAERVTIHWQGRAIDAPAGEDAAAALFAAGILVLGYSRKFWYDEELSAPVSSITSPGQVKRVYLDPRMK